MKCFALFIFALFCTFIIPFSAPAQTYGGLEGAIDVANAVKVSARHSEIKAMADDIALND